MKIEIPNPNDLSGLTDGDKIFRVNADGEILDIDTVRKAQNDRMIFTEKDVAWKTDGTSGVLNDGYLVPATPEMIEQYEAELAEWRIKVVKGLYDYLCSDEHGWSEHAGLFGDDLLRQIELKLKEQP